MVGGTSAEFREGDKVNLQDLLYGLMLPSGNDCALALSLYFGMRLLEKSCKGGRSGLEISYEQAIKKFVKVSNFHRCLNLITFEYQFYINEPYSDFWSSEYKDLINNHKNIILKFVKRVKFTYESERLIR